MTSNFLQLGLSSSEFLKALDKLRFIEPTPVQRLAIPKGLDERVNIIAQAKAGTGKTLAFSSILIDRLLKYQNDIDDQSGPIALILLPTRELAIQVFEFVEKLISTLRQINQQLLPNVKSGIFIGGLPLQDDRRNLKIQKVKIVVGTIGRIIALMKENSLKLEDIKIFVMDEADKLVEQKDFYKHISFIFQQLKIVTNNPSADTSNIQQKKVKPEETGENSEGIKIPSKSISSRNIQYLAFSATYSEDLKAKIMKLMGHSVFVDAIEGNNDDNSEGPDHANNKDLNLDNIQQLRVNIDLVENKSVTQLKINAMLHILNNLQFQQAIVFYNDKIKGENIFSELKAANFTALLINGDQTQADRIRLMNAIRRNKTQVIISTDLLARGIDISSIDLVINYDLPLQVDTYYHRIGRTGRFGRFGVSVLFVCSSDQKFLIENSKHFLRLENIPLDFTQINDKLAVKNEKELARNSQINKNQGFHLPGQVYHHEFTQGIIREEVDISQQYYDESNFKYFENSVSPIIFKEGEELSGSMDLHSESMSESDDNDEEIEESQDVIATQSKCQHNSQDEWSFLSCKICYQFLKEQEKHLNKKFKILEYFDSSAKSCF